MKKGIHPDNYRLVAFKDTNTGKIFITRSTAPSSEEVVIDGQKYPLVNVHISSDSHPFYTGQEKLLDVEGRVDKFKARQAAAEAAKKAREAKLAKTKTSAKPDKSSDETKKPTTQKLGR